MNPDTQEQETKKNTEPLKDLNPDKDPKGGGVDLDGQKKEELAPIQMPTSTP